MIIRTLALISALAVRYVWRGGTWHKSATLPKTTVANTEIYARSPLGALKIHR